MSASYPTIPADAVGWVTEVEMIEIDRIMIEDLGITLVQMMENAGRNLARVVLDLFSPRSVTVVAGSGGNGGGGMVAARHLANAGVDVDVVLSRPPDQLTDVPRHQLQILRRMGIATIDSPLGAGGDAGPDVIVDAVLGYSLRGAPRGRPLQLIDELTTTGRPIVSLDTPSGLDVTTGAIPGAVVGADVTMTLALPKTGLRHSEAVGQLLLADISVPRSVSGRYGAEPPNFGLAPILALA